MLAMQQRHQLPLGVVCWELCLCNNAKAVLLCLSGCSVVHCCNHQPVPLICVQMSGSEAFDTTHAQQDATGACEGYHSAIKDTGWQGSQGCKAEELTGRCTCFDMRYVADTFFWESWEALVCITAFNIASAEKALLNCGMWYAVL